LRKAKTKVIHDAGFKIHDKSRSVSEDQQISKQSNRVSGYRILKKGEFRKAEIKKLMQDS
jgi:hypothetical protein